MEEVLAEVKLRISMGVLEHPEPFEKIRLALAEADRKSVELEVLRELTILMG